MRKTAVFLIAGLVLAFVGYVVYDNTSRPNEIRVAVGMNGCVDQHCITFPLPQADVAVKFADGEVFAGKTDAAGIAHFHLDKSGPVEVTATSSLLSGTLTTRTTVDSAAGGYVSIELTDTVPFKILRAQ
ncbi:hypothetical protein AB0B66_16045 [Catellatospora sp. NPDC049111]|uniref:hypothetical protein n=1 Tax=Catellatospora sp. NPDC049111 TaxID=3155271 RepID=UPI0033F37B78